MMYMNACCQMFGEESEAMIKSVPMINVLYFSQLCFSNDPVI